MTSPQDKSLETKADNNTEADNNQVDSDRRKFLASCGRFAAVTPPAITLLLSTSMNSDAIAGSAGNGSSRPKHGNHNHNHKHHHHFDFDKWLSWWWKRMW